MHFQRRHSGDNPQRLRGASTVELAILLAAVVGILLLAVELVGLSTRGVYDSLAGSPGFGGHARRLQPDVFSPPVKARSNGPPQFVLPAAALALFVMSLWMSRRRRSGQQAPASLEEQARDLDPKTLVARRQRILASLTTAWRSLFEDRITVGQLAARQFRTVGPTTPVDQVLREFRAEAIHCMLVCEDHGALLGVIGERELRTPGATARDIMDRQPLTAAPSAPLSPAITAMLERDAVCLAVVEGSAVQGVLSYHDVMIGFQCTLRLLHRFAAGYDLGSLAAQHPSQTISGQRRARPQPTPFDESPPLNGAPPDLMPIVSRLDGVQS